MKKLFKIIFMTVFSVSLFADTRDPIVGKWEIIPELGVPKLYMMNTFAINKDKHSSAHCTLILGSNGQIGGMGDLFLFYNFRENRYLFFTYGHMGPFCLSGEITLIAADLIELELYNGPQVDIIQDPTLYTKYKFKRVSKSLVLDFPVNP